MTNTKEVNYSIQELLGVGFTLIVLGIGLAYGLNVNADIKADFGKDACAVNPGGYTTFSNGACVNGSGTANASAPPSTFQYNASLNSAQGVAKIPEKLPTIATVVVASVVIGILVTYLWARFSNM